jgi:hypothetical protein
LFSTTCAKLLILKGIFFRIFISFVFNDLAQVVENKRDILLKKFASEIWVRYNGYMEKGRYEELCEIKGRLYKDLSRMMDLLGKGLAVDNVNQVLLELGYVSQEQPSEDELMPSWLASPDRMGGQFTQSEISDSRNNW